MAQYVAALEAISGSMQSNLSHATPVNRFKLLGQLQAEHLTDEERNNNQQRWTMCNIILKRLEYMAEGKGPLLAELKQQDVQIEHTLGRFVTNAICLCSVTSALDAGHRQSQKLA